MATGWKCQKTHHSNETTYISFHTYEVHACVRIVLLIPQINRPITPQNLSSGKLFRTVASSYLCTKQLISDFGSAREMHLMLTWFAMILIITITTVILCFLTLVNEWSWGKNKAKKIRIKSIILSLCSNKLFILIQYQWNVSYENWNQTVCLGVIVSAQSPDYRNCILKTNRLPFVYRLFYFLS